MHDRLYAAASTEITNNLNHFNSYHPIQFTLKIKVAKQLHFLEITVFNTQHAQLHSKWWFTKNIWSQRYLNYRS